jgi:hypothetical protein
MKIYQILLYDRIERSTEDVEKFTGTEYELFLRLRELQLGYCGDEKPTVTEIEVKSKGGLIRTLVAESDSDFCYMAAIGKL